MDYTKQPHLFKLKKVARYVSLYGLSRTWIKVKGQYHMKKTYSSYPENDKTVNHSGHVGLIGCGNYAFSNIAYYLVKKYGKVIRACMDVNIDHAASMYEEYKLHYYSDNAEELINDPNIDTYFVASNHASHAEYAIQILDNQKNVHIEKPHVVSEDQLCRLVEALSRSKGKVLSIGYNRPISRIGIEIKNIVNQQNGAAMFNWFVAGHELDPNHWYFKDEEGGRVLGNLCHWTDFTYHLVGKNNRYPITIKPARSEKSDCDVAVSYIFGDGSIAAITFSAKSHTFEGVREKLSVHKGNVLLSMDDFIELNVEHIDKKSRTRLFFRDHGHKASILKSYQNLLNNNSGLSAKYIWESGQLFLKTKEALETNAEVSINGIEDIKGMLDYREGKSCQ